LTLSSSPTRTSVCVIRAVEESRDDDDDDDDDERLSVLTVTAIIVFIIPGTMFTVLSLLQIHCHHDKNTG